MAHRTRAAVRRRRHVTDVVLDEIQDATWHRLDPRMLLVHPVVELGRALPALVGVFVAGSTQGNHYWGLIGAGVVVVLSITRWFTTRLRITTEQVQLRQGLLRRKTISTSRDRIRTVDVTAHVLHRVLGLARVVVGTGINDRKGEGRIVLDGLPRETATTLRDELLHRRETGRAAGDAATSSPVRELAQLDRRWIKYAPFTLSGVLTGAVIWGFYWRIQGESGVNLLHFGPLRALSDTIGRLGTPAAVLVVTTALVVFVAVTSTVGYVLSFWNFRLVRHDGGTLQVTRGLLTTRATSIERRRLVGVALSEPLPLRAVGAARATVVATGLRTGRGAERGGEVLLPPAPKAAALAVASEVLDGSPAVVTPLQAHGAAARRRRYIRAVGCAAALCATAMAASDLGSPVIVIVVAGVGLVAAPPVAADRYRSLGHALVDGYLVAGTGSLVRRRAVLECRAVIGWNIRRSFFQRRAGLATLTATTAAGRQGYAIHDLGAPEAVALAAAVSPELLAQFDSALPATSSPAGRPPAPVTSAAARTARPR